MKYEWRKTDKYIYIPKAKAEVLDVPAMNYLVIEGEGRPGNEDFAQCIGALYSISYGIKMKKDLDGYYEYTVFPLEGIWNFTNKGIELYKQSVKAKDLKEYMSYQLMIRQPDFVTSEIVQATRKLILGKKKEIPRISEVRFETIVEGKSVQILHLGSYDNEPASFEIIEAFCEKEGLIRKSKRHKEIYLSDARRVAPENLKTTLRVWVE